MRDLQSQEDPSRIENNRITINMNGERRNGDENVNGERIRHPGRFNFDSLRNGNERSSLNIASTSGRNWNSNSVPRNENRIRNSSSVITTQQYGRNSSSNRIPANSAFSREFNAATHNFNNLNRDRNDSSNSNTIPQVFDSSNRNRNDNSNSNGAFQNSRNSRRDINDSSTSNTAQNVESRMRLNDSSNLNPIHHNIDSSRRNRNDSFNSRTIARPINININNSVHNLHMRDNSSVRFNECIPYNGDSSRNELISGLDVNSTDLNITVRNSNGLVSVAYNCGRKYFDYTAKSGYVSGNETPTLGSSGESNSSYGFISLGNHFSDTSDGEHTFPSRRINVQEESTKKENKLTRFFSTITSATLSAKSNSNSNRDKNNMDVRTPLLMLKHDTTYGNNNHKDYGYMDNHDLLITSAQFFDTYKFPKEKQVKQSSFVTIFAVWNTIMGSSLLTMAWGMERAGLLPGILIMLFMGGLCLFTSYILLQVCSHHGDSSTCEVPDLCRLLLGRWAELVAHAFSFLVMVGANIVYWVLMTNFLYHSVIYFKEYPFNTTSTADDVLCPRPAVLLNLSSPNEEQWGGRYWDMNSSVPVYVVIIIFPLLNFNSTAFFTKFNSLGTLSALYLILFVTVKGWSWGLHIDSWLSELTLKTDASVLSGMLALSFYIHNIIITVMRNNKQQDKNGRDLSIAFFLVTLTYMLVGAVFYVCFPLAKTCIQDNILDNFARSDIMTAIARVLLLFQVITVYPLMAYMLRVQILPHLYKSTFPTLLFNICLVTICVLFACFVPNIGVIIRYTGAISGLMHVFTLPSLLQVTSLHKRGKLTVAKLVFYFCIFVIGACNLVAQFFVSG